MKEELISQVTILYVEDEESIRERLVRFLKRRNCSIIEGQNGQDGLEKFKNNKVDMIITDIRMPVMDGLSMAEEIRKINQDVPIIITTGHNDESFFLRSIDIGIDKYLKKPIDFKNFIGTVAKFAEQVLVKKQIEAHNKFIKTIIDINPYFMAITDGKDISYLNRNFLEYLGYDTVEEFCKHHDSINDFLVETDGCFYTDKPFEQWISEIINSEGEDFYAYMADRRMEAEKELNSYIIQVNEIPAKNEWLMTFIDVTRLEREKQLYMIMSMQDPLTGIYNRKKFFEEVALEIERVERYNQNLSLIMLDVDKFKTLNDTYGHQYGDTVLTKITDIIKDTIRKTDVFARYGGEEFAILMPGTDLIGAIDFAERLRKKIEDYEYSKQKTVTCSFGVAKYEKMDTVDSFIKKADLALYRAKELGRNRVESFEKGGLECIE